jgi:toxin FitB
MIILDTNVVSALMRERPESTVREWLDRQPRSSVWTTSVTVFEIRVGLLITAVGRQRTRLQRDFEAILGQDLDGRILPFDAVAADETAVLMSERRKSGRTGDLRDGMIAGIAIARHATLATHNTRHFADLTVAVVDPWTA